LWTSFPPRISGNIETRIQGPPAALTCTEQRKILRSDHGLYELNYLHVLDYFYAIISLIANTNSAKTIPYMDMLSLQA
jgi:hypothetical protein